MANQKQALDQASKNKFADMKRARAFRDMMNTEGWKFYTELLNRHIEVRTQNLFGPTPEGGRDAEQHNKGAVYALILARDLPSVTVSAMKELVEEINEARQPANEDLES
jgi:hypothetical protein